MYQGTNKFDFFFWLLDRQSIHNKKLTSFWIFLGWIHLLSYLILCKHMDNNLLCKYTYTITKGFNFYYCNTFRIITKIRLALYILSLILTNKVMQIINTHLVIGYLSFNNVKNKKKYMYCKNSNIVR